MEMEKKYISSHGIDTSFMYRIKKGYLDSLKTMTYALDTENAMRGRGASAVQIRMYSRDGNFIYGWQQCFGNINFFRLFRTVPISCKKTYLPINKHLNFWNDIKLYDISPAEKLGLTEKIKSSKYIIVVYWAEWVGHFSKSTLRKVNHYVNSNKKENILFIKVNTAPYEAAK